MLRLILYYVPLRTTTQTRYLNEETNHHASIINTSKEVPILWPHRPQQQSHKSLYKIPKISQANRVRTPCAAGRNIFSLSTQKQQASSSIKTTPSPSPKSTQTLPSWKCSSENHLPETHTKSANTASAGYSGSWHESYGKEDHINFTSLVWYKMPLGLTPILVPHYNRIQECKLKVQNLVVELLPRFAVSLGLEGEYQIARIWDSHIDNAHVKGL